MATEHSLIGAYNDRAAYRPGKMIVLPNGKIDSIRSHLSALSGPSDLFRLTSMDTLRVFWTG